MKTIQQMIEDGAAKIEQERRDKEEYEQKKLRKHEAEWDALVDEIKAMLPPVVQAYVTLQHETGAVLSDTNHDVHRPRITIPSVAPIAVLFKRRYTKDGNAYLELCGKQPYAVGYYRVESQYRGPHYVHYQSQHRSFPSLDMALAHAAEIEKSRLELEVVADARNAKMADEATIKKLDKAAPITDEHRIGSMFEDLVDQVLDMREDYD